MASLFIRFLFEKYVTCQSRKSDFEWHRFRFSRSLMRKRVAKSKAILPLLDTFCHVLMRVRRTHLDGSLQIRFIESMRAHVITIYGKRTGRP